MPTTLVNFTKRDQQQAKILVATHRMEQEHKARAARIDVDESGKVIPVPANPYSFEHAMRHNAAVEYFQSRFGKDWVGIVADYLEIKKMRGGSQCQRVNY